MPLTSTSSPRRLARSAGAPRPALERLEARSLLSGTPLPSVNDLQNPSHSVIRMETTFGDIDIELFDDLAPNTVTNFLRYITSGKLDRSFFHRMVNNQDNPNTPGVNEAFGVLQGGGYYFEDFATPNWSEVPADAPIALEHDVGNIERTIAMARTNARDSATSQFFFNMIDNSASLDHRDPGSGFPNGRDGYAVFGRVIQGWSVVQQIQTFTIRDLSLDPSFAGNNGLFNEVPTTAAYNPNAGVRESALVYLVNAEIVKPSGANTFYTQRLVMPEGNHAGNATEFLNLFNPNSTPASYQIIAHYETGLRDTVIQTGTLGANTSLQLQLSSPSSTLASMVRSNSPYALEVHTSVPTSNTNPLPIAAASVRKDFGAQTSESYISITGASDASLQTWDFPRFERNALSREFLVWQSLSSSSGTLTITFYRAGASNVTISRTLAPYRRGGLELFNLGLADGLYSARVTSSVPIAASLSDFDLPASGQDPATASTPAWAVNGVNGGGATTGVLPRAEIQAGFSNVVSILNPNSITAVVTFSFRRDGSVAAIQRVVVLPQQSRTDYLLDASILGIPENERFTITYTSGSANLALQYTSVDETNRNLSGGARADGFALAFEPSTAEALAFTNGFNDPTRTDATQSEILSLFNPFANTSISLAYDVVARFADGSQVSITGGTLAAGGRLDIALDQQGPLRAKTLSGPQFQTYTLVVRGTATQGSNTRSIAPFAMLARRDTTRVEAIGAQPVALGPTTAYNNAIFGVGGTI